MFFCALSSTIFSKASLLLATIFCSALPGLAQGARSWHTNGNQILDSNGGSEEHSFWFISQGELKTGWRN